MSESAVETLDKNSPSGLLESALAGVIFSTSDKYFSAELLSPDLIADIRSLSKVSKLLPLLDELPDVDKDAEVDVDDDN